MRIVLFALLLCLCKPAEAQSNLVLIDSISVQGNKKTLTKVILREMTLQEGDRVPLSKLADELKRSRDFLMNTRLFADVKINYANWEAKTNRVHLQVTVQETWYLYPLPFFDLADRSFNVWVNEHNASLQRVNFGIDFTHLNLTGRRDLLSLDLTYGYTRRYGLRYSLPYLDKQQILGMTSYVFYDRSREFNYLTENNRQVFFNVADRFTNIRFSAGTRIDIRPGLLRTHSVELSFHQNRIAEEVASELNPDYFLDGRAFQRFARFSYQFRFDDRDVRGYPLDGRFIGFQLEKAGLGLYDDRNALTAFAQYFHFEPITDRWYVNYWMRGKFSIIRQQQPYNDNRALGFRGNDMRGYEYYIVDGLDMFIGSIGVTYQVLDHEINFGKLMPFEAFKRMPFRLYLTLDNNVGYVNNPFSTGSNTLDNRWLWGGGPGIDLVFFYDMAFRVQYSINHLWETGLFFQFNTNI